MTTVTPSPSELRALADQLEALLKLHRAHFLHPVEHQIANRAVAAMRAFSAQPDQVHLAAPSSLKESGPQRDAFEQWYDRQPSGRLNPIDVWTAAIEYAARSGHACEYALDYGGNIYRRYREPQCAFGARSPGAA